MSITESDLRTLRCLDPRYPGLCLLGREQGHDHREREMIARGLAKRSGEWVVLTPEGVAALRGGTR